MKRLLISASLLALLAAGGLGAWMLLRRTPASLEMEAEPMGWLSEPAGPGHLIHLSDTRTPLRLLRWLPSMPGEWVIAQVLTQSDRQFLVLARAGRIQQVLPLPPPDAATERFFRFAELQAAALPCGDQLVLLYGPGHANAPETAVLVVLDLPGGTVRWHRQGPWQHVATHGEGQDALLLLWAPEAPVTRLRARDGQPLGPPVPWPAEVEKPVQLLPTGPTAFLVSHAKGLSSYASKGWIHHPLPEEEPLRFPDGQGRLARTQDAWWWQPRPGYLLKVRADGTPEGRMHPAGFHPGEADARDARLLDLLGTDAEGRLWFGLAAPILASSAKGSTPSPAPLPEEGWQSEGEAAPGAENEGLPFPEREAWQEYLQKPMDRTHRWDPVRNRTETLAWNPAWTSLQPPADVQPPRSAPPGDPAAGGILLGSGTRRWWLPTAALPFQPRADGPKTAGSYPR